MADNASDHLADPSRQYGQHVVDWQRAVRSQQSGSYTSSGHFAGQDWRGCDFSKTNWTNESFAGCDLRRTDFSGCDLTGCDFKNAILFDADFTDADLSRAINLVSKQLSGTELTRAQLPTDLRGFPYLSTVTELSQSGSKVFIALLGVAAFILISLATQRDIDILDGSRGTKLPVIDAVVSPTAFLVAAPILILTLFVYFHLYLMRLWEMLSQLPAVFPDGRRLDEASFPWLMNDLCREHFPRLRETRPTPTGFQNLVSLILGFALTPAVLLLIWAHAVRAHLLPLTVWHAIVVGISIGLAGWFHWALRHAFISRQLGYKGSAGWRGCRPLLPWVLGAVAFPLLLLAWSNNVFCTRKAPVLWTEKDESASRWAQNLIAERTGVGDYVPDDPGAPEVEGRQPGPLLFFYTGISPWLSLENAEFTKRPENWKGTYESFLADYGSVKEIVRRDLILRHARAQHSFVARASFLGGDFTGADFHQSILHSTVFTFIDATRSNFAKTRFSPNRERRPTPERFAELAKLIPDSVRSVWRRSILDEAYFHAAKLDCVKFSGTSLIKTNFKDANLAHVHFLGSIVKDTNFEGADLSETTWRGWNKDKTPRKISANFTGSTCYHANFGDSDLSESIFANAELQRADFSQVVGLRFEQLLYAKSIREVVLPKEWEQHRPDWVSAVASRISGDPPWTGEPPKSGSPPAPTEAIAVSPSMQTPVLVSPR